MKFFLLILFFAFQAEGSVTPEERKEAISTANAVMLEMNGEEGQSLKLINARVVDELGTRLIVEFMSIRNSYGTRLCNYGYDRVLKRVIKDSWTCELQ